MSDCLFCKIVSGEIPSYTVYEDEFVLAFLDIHPCSKGHTVMIPKEHVESLNEMPPDKWEKMFAGMRAVVGRVQKIISPDGMNIGINNGKAAGQAVGHAHWHIISRWDGDGGGSMHSIIRKVAEVDVNEISKLFL
ncbi:MAG: HIT family protein [Patescibacteria group bacterium]|mgnify:FL=1